MNELTTKGIVIDFEKAKNGLYKREHEKENKNKRVRILLKYLKIKCPL